MGEKQTEEPEWDKINALNSTYFKLQNVRYSIQDSKIKRKVKYIEKLLKDTIAEFKENQIQKWGK